MNKQREQAYIFGKHALLEGLTRVPEAIRRLYVIPGHDTKAVTDKARELNIPIDRCDEGHLPRGVEKDAVHQGVIGAVSPHKILKEYKPFIQALSVTEHTCLVLLDELTDPHNVGAIIRSAAAFGVSAVLVPEFRQAQITGTVVKVSAGMVFAVPLVSITNVNTVLRDLKDRGFWIYGLTGEGDTSLSKEEFTKPSVFIFGNEGRGMREKTEEVCDFRLSIPIEQGVESLNVASSASVTLYAWKTYRERNTANY